MDYAALSAMRSVSAPQVLFSYDIACQWSKHFVRRAREFPLHLQMEIDPARTRYAIPKFHLPAHGPQCHSKFSLNYMRDVGRTYGEGVESVWAHINGTAVSTREMTPAFRHETLDAHFGSWNWAKILSFFSFFPSKLKEAVRMAEEQQKVLDEFEDSLSDEDISTWAHMVSSWDDGLSSKDPYEVPEQSGFFELTVTIAESSFLGITERQILQEFATNDLADLQSGTLAHDSVSARTFVSDGLKLEKIQ